MTGITSRRRAPTAHAAISASLALSCVAVSDSASAQPANAIPLDPIDVSGESTGGQAVNIEGDRSFNVQRASSPKLTSPLLDTPQTVTVIPQVIIQEQGARNLTEVLRNTPGITFDAGENGFGTSTNNFKIRGFDSSGSIFIDGARDSGSYTRDVFNVERVEVFKGAAADNGRGGAGGYVNMVTKTPTLQNFLAGDISYGWDQYNSKDRRRGTIDANYVIAPHTAIRFNGLLEDSGVAGREIAEMNPRGLAPSIAFGLGTAARAIFAYEHVKRKDVPDWGVPGATIPGLVTNIRTGGIASGAPRDAFYGLRSDFDHTTSDSFMARFEYDFTKGATISNQTRWARVDRLARYTVPTGFNAPREVTTQGQLYDRVNTSLTNLTNVSAEFYTGPIRHNISTGFEFTSEESNANRYGTIVVPPTDLFDPNPDRFGGVMPFPTQTNGIKINTIAAYLYDTIHLNRHWEINGGLRAERYTVDFANNDALTGAPIVPLDGYEDRQATLSGRIGLVFKPVENGSIYAAYSVSHQPPGSFLSNPDISRTGDNAFPGFVPGVKPIRADNYEVGVKWDFFNRRLSTAVALFHTVKKNVPITGLDAGQAGAATFKGYGEQEVRGIELSIAGALTEHWNIFGGIVFMDSERKQSAYLDEVRRRANPADFVGWDGQTYCCTNGNQLSFTPDVSATLWTTYNIPTTKWTIGGGLQYVTWSWVGRPDDALRTIPNGVFGTMPGYTVFNAMASYAVTKDIVVRFNIDNITDEKYAAATNWNTSRATLGAPRTYRMGASFKF